MKKRVNFSIEEEVKAEFDKLCVKMSINKSAWVEQKIKEFIAENEGDSNNKK